MEREMGRLWVEDEGGRNMRNGMIGELYYEACGPEYLLTLLCEYSIHTRCITEYVFHLSV